jgi:hypothetical protein
MPEVACGAARRVDEPTLADARLSRDENELTVAATHVGQNLAEDGEIEIATDQGAPHRGPDRGCHDLRA